MDSHHVWDDQKDVMMDFIQKMCDSGYDHQARMEVILSGVKKFYRQVIEQESGGRRIYRSQEDMASARRLKSFRNKTWFRNRRGGMKLTPSYLGTHNPEKRQQGMMRQGTKLREREREKRKTENQE